MARASSSETMVRRPQRVCRRTRRVQGDFPDGMQRGGRRTTVCTCKVANRDKPMPDDE